MSNIWSGCLPLFESNLCHVFRHWENEWQKNWNDSPDRLLVRYGIGDGLNDWIRNIHVARKCPGILGFSRIVIDYVDLLRSYLITWCTMCIRTGPFISQIRRRICLHLWGTGWYVCFSLRLDMYIDNAPIISGNWRCLICRVLLANFFRRWVHAPATKESVGVLHVAHPRRIKCYKHEILVVLE